MKINIKSNFVVPGVEDRDLVDAAPMPIEYVRPGARVLDPDDWEVDINDIPYQKCDQELETPLSDGDTVNIRIMALGGG
jgi:hypothetical protein